MKYFLSMFALLGLLLSAPLSRADMPAAPVTPAKTDAPAGVYALDKTHASVTFRINHLGLSHYTARFTRMEAELKFDPAHPEAMSVTATVDPHSIKTDYPNKEPDFDAELQKDKWLDTGKYPEMTFKSTKVELTGPNTARVTGDFTLHGMTKPVTLDVTYNGFMHLDMGAPGDHIGFSAHGSLKRSDFGVKEGIPQPGSNMGVGDDVEFIIEAEFVKPAPAAPAPQKP
jgi:polyisoprenoid-binding protein YceI